MSFDSKIPANTNQVKNLLSTGVVSGGIVTTSNVTATTADVTISDSVFRFVDNTTDPNLPNFKGDKVFSETTLIGVNITAAAKIIIPENLVAFSEVFTGTDTPTQRRTRIELVVIAVDGSVILSYANVAFDTQGLLKDTAEAMGRVVVSGLAISSNGVNLSFDRESVKEYSPFFDNFPTSRLDPMNSSLSAVSPVTFFETWIDTGQPSGFNLRFGRTVLTPGIYDDGTPDASAPNGVVTNNQAGIGRVYEASGTFGYLFPQQTYNSISAAVNAIATEVFVQSPFFINTAFRGYIVVRGGATDLSLSSDALFFQPSMPFVTVRAD